jgi:FkbM family methyltransferase
MLYNECRCSLQPVRVLAIRSHVQQLFRRLGWEVQRVENTNSERQLLKKLLRLTAADVVLDVGANTGQFGDLLLEIGFTGTLVSFEAQPEIHARLLRHANASGRSWLVAPCAALGSQRGQIELNISANSVSSSILPMRQIHLESAPQSKYVGKQTVNIERLDELAAAYLAPTATVFLKIDTQGYELEVLKGATGLLARTAALQLELSLVPLYAQAPSFVDMVAHMASRNYELFGLVPGFRDPTTGRALQMDGFFVRADRHSRG